MVWVEKVVVGENLDPLRLNLRPQTVLCWHLPVAGINTYQMRDRRKCLGFD
jgi:hypothetical protein